MVSRGLIHLDHSLRLWVLTHRLDLLNPVMWAVSVVGRGGVAWLVVGLAFTVARHVRPWQYVQLACAILLASIGRSSLEADR